MSDTDGTGDTDVLTTAFEQNRAHLRGVAYRLLGSMTDADDAVQETWLRLTSTDTSAVENLGGWLTTVVARAVARGAVVAASSRAGSSRLALIDGDVGIVFAPAGQLRIALKLAISDRRKITAIDVIADPERLRGLQLAVLPD